MNQHELFQQEVRQNIQGLAGDQDLQALSRTWMRDIAKHKWVYNFAWFGRPAIQFPTDAWAMQELIWSVRPDLIIETGIAHGGSLIFYASMLAMLDMCDAIEQGATLDPRASGRKVLGLDIDIRVHNREAIEAHPMATRIQMIQGSSVAPEVVSQVHGIAKSYKKVMVCLDSNHTHDHVLAEMEAYAPLVTTGSYCVVFDTLVEDMPAELCVDRPWKPGNSPKTAVLEYLRRHGGQYEIDQNVPDKLLLTVAPDGYLRRVD